MKILGIVHKEVESCYGIYFPHVPGCFSAGDTPEELIENSKEALRLHGKIATPAKRRIFSDLEAEDLDAVVCGIVFFIED